PHGTAAVVRVEDPGGIAADNERYALVGGVSKPAVLVVTGAGDMTREAFYVQHALSAGGVRNATFQVVGTSGAQLASWTDDRLAPHAAVFLLSTRGLERRGRELLSNYARSGGGLFIAASGAVDGDIVADVPGSGSTLQIAAVEAAKAPPRALAPADVRHPIFRAFSGNGTTLGLVRFDRIARIAGSGCQTLARFTTGDPAFLECPAGDGRALV